MGIESDGGLCYRKILQGRSAGGREGCCNFNEVKELEEMTPILQEFNTKQLFGLIRLQTL